MSEVTETPDAPDDFEPITSREQFEKMLGGRLERERNKFKDYPDLKQKAAEFDKLQEASKSEMQKLQDRLAAAEKQAEMAGLNALRAQVAAEKGVPANRLNGATKEELEADADELLGLIRAQQKEAKPKVPLSSLKSGASGDDSRMDPKERAAAALRGLRNT